MMFTTTIILGFSAFLFAYYATLGVLGLMRYLAVVDEPNERGNHAIPTPRGGGLAVTLVALSFMFIAGFKVQLLLVGLLLAGVSFLDDLRGLSAGKRLAVHLVVALYAGSVMDGYVFQGLLPFWARRS